MARLIHPCWRNIFLLPSGKSFVREITKLLQAFASGSTMEDTALKASFVMQILLLQKPLVLSTTGGMGREAATKRLADEISRKEGKQYSVIMGWIQCRLSFAILRSAILCIRGSRSSRHCPTHELNIPLAASEGPHMFPLPCSEVCFFFIICAPYPLSPSYCFL